MRHKKENMMCEFVRDRDRRESFQSSSVKQRQESETEGREERGRDRRDAGGTHRAGEGGGPAR